VEKEITQRNEIVAILNNMRLKHLGVSLKEKEKKFNLSGFITRADTNAIAVFFDKIPESVPLKNLRICFDYNRNFYASSETALRMLNVSIKSVEISVPEKIVYHSVRRHARIEAPESVHLNIKKVETTALEAASTINIDELPATLRSIYLELQVDTPDLKKIIGMIGDELSRYSNRFKINMFKDLNNLTPIEKVVNIYRKTFWIGDTDNLNNYIHLGDKYSIIGYEKYFDMIKKTMSPSVLEQIRQSYISRGINSYAMVPIIVGDRVVGVIEVSIPDDPKFKKLTIYEIFYIKGLADILGEVIVKSQTTTTNIDSNFRVIDISMGGALANTKNLYLTHTIKENSIVVVELMAFEKNYEFRSRVVRYNYIPGENAGLNVAFEFIVDTDAKKAELEEVLKKFIKSGSDRSDRKKSAAASK
jgi:hypothetical protein